jgi:hypothetical protein
MRGPAQFLQGQRDLEADAYSVYDAFFRSERAMTEVGCWMYARRSSRRWKQTRNPLRGISVCPDRFSKQVVLGNRRVLA